ncbi:hypothetical protein Ahy_B10g102963 [Arachis hypogaea]|uniref:Aminotransferase-like plant mobile domain-containing protein n=1 Tax=Arachis hypogaea TaxID=3818 RepID=A0A444X343_ARAHY|nr:hypothetical protein Ahy_B10g102963 [Arachis hypogaea]
MVEWEHDWLLISTLMERWRPESHTFHLPCGELTITLHDVAYQLGLSVNIWVGRQSIEELCQQLLGVTITDEVDCQVELVLEHCARRAAGALGEGAPTALY